MSGLRDNGACMALSIAAALAGVSLVARRGSQARRRKKKKEPIYHCETCGRQLPPGEAIACIDCDIARTEALLNSEGWMKIRGPYMADTMRAELAALKARRGSGSRSTDTKAGIIARIEGIMSEPLDAQMRRQIKGLSKDTLKEVFEIAKRRGSRAALTAAQRVSMAQSQFAVPQRRTFPIDTRARAIKALAYAKWPNNKRWESQVRKAVFACYPELLAKYGTAVEKRRAA